ILSMNGINIEIRTTSYQQTNFNQNIMNTRHLRFLILLYLSVSYLTGYGQYFDGHQLVKTGMSPEPYSFFKQTDIPMDYSRGLPDISIPIYTFSLNGYELPISMSYHSSGIRVDEIA